jgi:choline dehydrogenase-like flavoprotein
MSRPDAIIIGAGAGGAAMAWRLTQHKLNVLLIEAGPRYEPSKDYRLNMPRWELERFPFKPNAQGRHCSGQVF